MAYKPITIKQLYPSIKVIMLSTAKDLATYNQCVESRRDAYVLKDAGSGSTD
jgi:DNA-binding NarL/FixJ family response regulator